MEDTLRIRIEEADKKALRQLAAKNGLRPSQLGRLALKHFIENPEIRFSVKPDAKGKGKGEGK